MIFQIIGGGLILDFATLAEARRCFEDERVSGEDCQLNAITWTYEAGPDGKHVRREMLEARGMVVMVLE